MKVWLDGKIVNRSEASISVLDHGLLYGDGVFEGLRILNRRVFRLADHLRRLELSAMAIGLTIPWYAIEVSRNRLAPAWFNHCSTTGVLISPDQALAAGFFDQLVEPADHAAAVAQEAERLAGLDRTAHAATKLRIRATAIELVRAGIDQEFPEPD